MPNKAELIVEDRKGVERVQRAHDKLLLCAGSTDAGLGGKSRRSGAAHVPLVQEQYQPPNDDGVRSRSGCARRYRPMLSGRPMVARFVRRNEIETVREDERLKRSASLRAPEYAGHLRS